MVCQDYKKRERGKWKEHTFSHQSSGRLNRNIIWVIKIIITIKYYIHDNHNVHIVYIPNNFD